MAISFNSGFMAAMSGQSNWLYFEILIAACFVLASGDVFNLQEIVR